MIYIELFLLFLKIGAFTFGGGYAMLPFINEEILEREWLTAEELMNFVAVSESTPGPFAVNIATYIGVERAGVPGGICATLGVVLPSFVIILIVAKFFFAFRQSKTVSGIMSGIRPVAIGLIASAGYSLIYTVFYTGFGTSEIPFTAEIIIFAISLFIVLKKKSPISALLLSAAIGVAAGYIFA